jgi:hypothetical protein
LPAKSKHGRGKHSHHKKKDKFRQVQAGTGLTQETSGDILKAGAPSSTAPVVKAPVQKKAMTSAALPLHYEFIAGDLKRIGILTGIIIVLLIVAYYIFF